MNNLEKKQFQQILNYLVETTKDGTREWKLAKHLFNSDTAYHMESFSDDNKTRFESVVKLVYDDNSKLIYVDHGCMTIHNKGFNDGGYKVLGLNDNRDILVLEKLVFTNFVKPLLPTVAPNTVFDDILGGMGKQYTRDKKLEHLLEGVELEPEKKKGFLSRIF